MFETIVAAAAVAVIATTCTAAATDVTVRVIRAMPVSDTHTGSSASEQPVSDSPCEFAATVVK